MKKIVVLGAGGHAKVAIETLREAGEFEIVGLLERGNAGARVLGLPVLGDDSMLCSMASGGVAGFFPAIGENRVRQAVAAKALHSGLAMVNAISPKSHVSPTASVGQGVLIVAGAVVNAEARLGDLVIVNTRASVDHDCEIGAAAHLAPGSTLAGGVRVGAGSLVGAGATILPGRKVGSQAIVGAGACVIADVPDGATVVGVPARALSNAGV